jgi:hypothetical protein
MLSFPIQPHPTRSRRQTILKSLAVVEIQARSKERSRQETLVSPLLLLLLLLLLLRQKVVRPLSLLRSMDRLLLL